MNCTVDKVMDKSMDTACEISDMELDTVSGGYRLIGRKYEKPENVVFLFEVGSHVEAVTAYFWRVFTVGCTVLNRKVALDYDGQGYCAWYKVSSSDGFFDNKWFAEKEFEGGFFECLP